VRTPPPPLVPTHFFSKNSFRRLHDRFSAFVAKYPALVDGMLESVIPHLVCFFDLGEVLTQLGELHKRGEEMGVLPDKLMKVRLQPLIGSTFLIEILINHPQPTVIFEKYIREAADVLLGRLKDAMQRAANVDSIVSAADV
jgi:hypothetical protein